MGGWGDFILRTGVRKVVYVLVGLALAAILAATGVKGATGDAMVLLEQHTASGSATVDFTSFVSGTYDEYMVEGLGIVPASNGVALYMRFGTGAGPTYSAAALYYSGGTNSTAVEVATPITNAAQYGEASFSLRLGNVLSSSLMKHAFGTAVWHDGSTVQPYMRGWLWATVTPVTAIRFLMSSGNIASGVFRVYGIGGAVGGAVGGGSTDIGCGMVAGPSPSATPAPSYQPCHVVIDNAGATLSDNNTILAYGVGLLAFLSTAVLVVVGLRR